MKTKSSKTNKRHKAGQPRGLSVSPGSPPFFLEISARQVGKTTRLYKAAIAHSVVGDVVVYVSCWAMGERTRDALARLVAPNKLVVCVRKSDEPKKLNNPRRFFDEWDFIQDCPYDENGYYCATLRTLRTDEDKNGSDLFGLLWRRANGGVVNVRNAKLAKPPLNLGANECGEIFQANSDMSQPRGQGSGKHE